jgi:hypothetical protein
MAPGSVFLTDVGLQQVFKFSHDGKQLLALGEPRVGAWDATHFNQPTDIAIRPDGTFYVSDGYVNSRVAIFDKNGKELREWGRKARERVSSATRTGSHSFPAAPTCWSPIARTRDCSCSTRTARSSGSGSAERRGDDGRVFAVAADAAGNYYVGIRRADYDTQHTGV